jgi:hypothetical protein
MHNLTVTGPADPELFTPSITIFDSFTALYKMQIDGAVQDYTYSS